MRRNSMSGYSRHFAEKAKPNNNDKIVRMPHGMVLNSYCVFSLELVIFISKVHTYTNVLSNSARFQKNARTREP